MARRQLSSAMLRITWTQMAGRWIGRGGQIAWPPKLSDLTPSDIFLWDYVENILY
jgi:hypothetical protein